MTVLSRDQAQSVDRALAQGRIEKELRSLRAEVADLRKEKEKILKLWTDERARLLAERRGDVVTEEMRVELRDLRVRDRAVRKALDLYLTGGET